MSIMTATTRITRQYLERKTKAELAQMYLDLLDRTCAIEDAVDLAVTYLEDGAPATALIKLKPFETEPRRERVNEQR